MSKNAKVVDIAFLGKNMRRLREAANLSMQDLANLAEIEKSQIARIEIGKSDPRLTTLLIIAKALNVTLEELLKRHP